MSLIFSFSTVVLWPISVLYFSPLNGRFFNSLHTVWNSASTKKSAFFLFLKSNFLVFFFCSAFVSYLLKIDIAFQKYAARKKICKTKKSRQFRIGGKEAFLYTFLFLSKLTRVNNYLLEWHVFPFFLVLLAGHHADHGRSDSVLFAFLAGWDFRRGCCCWRALADSYPHHPQNGATETRRGYQTDD